MPVSVFRQNTVLPLAVYMIYTGFFPLQCPDAQATLVTPGFLCVISPRPMMLLTVGFSMRGVNCRHPAAKFIAGVVHVTVVKGKDRKRIYIAPFIYYVYLKALRHGSHSFTCKYTMPAFPSYAFTRWRHL